MGRRGASEGLSWDIGDKPEWSRKRSADVRPGDQEYRGLVKIRKFFRDDFMEIMRIAFDVSQVGLDLRHKHKLYNI